MTTTTRESWDEYFLRIAEVVASRSTCERKQVGAVLVIDNRIVATGYCGSLPGEPHCLDVGCEIDPATGGCVRTVHAEINALAQCASHGIRTEGATCYLTLSPCASCFKALAMAGIARIVYSEQYRIPPNFELAEALRIELKRVQKVVEITTADILAEILQVKP